MYLSLSYIGYMLYLSSISDLQEISFKSNTVFLILLALMLNLNWSSNQMLM